MQNYRLSSYTIFVKLNDSDDKYLMVHGYTGAIDIASGTLVSFLRSGKDMSAAGAGCSEATWKRLVDRGYITRKSSSEEQEFFVRMAESYHMRAKAWKSFCFLVAYDCNFRCPYCCENGLSDKGSHWSGKVLTKEMVDRIYDAMLEIEPERKRHTRKIYLYGGEPLMSKNREIVDYIIERGMELGYTFKAVTNGYELESYAQWLGPEGLCELQITLDGSPDYHNKRRIHYTGVGTFDRIMSNIGLALSKGVEVRLRMNIDKENVEEVSKIKQLCDELGYYDKPNFKIYSSPILLEGVNETDSQNNDSQQETFDYRTLNQILQEKAPEVNCQDFHVFTKLYTAISTKGKVNLSPVSCAAQTGMYVFDPDNKIYGCIDTVGQPGYVRGEFKEGRLVWTEGHERWQNDYVAKRTTCSKCKYALLCGGGCAFRRKANQNGQFTSGYCKNYAAIFEMSANKAYVRYQARLHE